MNNVVIFETSHYVDDRVYFADVGQKLVAKSLAFARTLHQAGNVYKFNGGGQNPLGVHKAFKYLEAFVGHRDNTYIGLDGTERKVRSFRLII